jgi:hypothetical protein
VRPGSAVRSTDGSVSYKAGDEFTIPDSEAASFLQGKRRRSFEIVEVLDDSSTDDAAGETQNHPRNQ